MRWAESRRRCGGLKGTALALLMSRLLLCFLVRVLLGGRFQTWRSFLLQRAVACCRSVGQPSKDRILLHRSHRHPNPPTPLHSCFVQVIQVEEREKHKIGKKKVVADLEKKKKVVGKKKKIVGKKKKIVGRTSELLDKTHCRCTSCEPLGRLPTAAKDRSSEHSGLHRASLEW